MRYSTTVNQLCKNDAAEHSGDTSHDAPPLHSHITSEPIPLPSSSTPAMSEINCGPTAYQETVASEAAESNTESTKFGNSEITNTDDLNTVPREAVNAVLGIEAKNAEAGEANNTRFDNKTVNKVSGKVRQPEAENEEQCDRRGEVAAGGTTAVEDRDEEDQPGAVDVVPVEERGVEETMDPSETPDNLSAALRAIKGNGTFATSGHFSSTPNPALSINGIGVIGLPLCNRDAEIIIAVGTQAPFGNGERTVVDKDVRDTWELQPNQLQFLNPAWNDWIEKEVMVKAANDLRVADPAQTVKCELHKLLLYKEGGHFLPHKEYVYRSKMLIRY